MNEDEILSIEQGYSESKIQHTCVCWFRQTFPHVAELLFAVPNGGWRGARTGAQMKYEGQVKGVSDLILFYPSGGKASLCVEMKRPHKKGRTPSIQSEEQKQWQKLVERYGHTYVVCHGIIEFATAVCTYLRLNPQPHINKILANYPLYR